MLAVTVPVVAVATGMIVAACLRPRGVAVVSVNVPRGMMAVLAVGVLMHMETLPGDRGHQIGSHRKRR